MDVKLQHICPLGRPDARSRVPRVQDHQQHPILPVGCVCGELAREVGRGAISDVVRTCSSPLQEVNKAQAFPALSSLPQLRSSFMEHAMY
jgi:hypothetical protein